MANATSFLSTNLRRWRRVPAHLRWIASFLACVAVASIIVGVFYQRQQAHEWLLGGRVFSSRQLNEIESALAQSGLNDFDFLDGRVRIPREQRHAYVVALSCLRWLPFPGGDPLQKALDQTNPFESSQQRTARIELAQERELADCIRRMSGIEDATVHLDEAVTGVGLRRQRKVTAMVVVQPDSNSRLEGSRIDSIRQLVAASRVNLSIADVTVADLSSGVSYVGSGPQNRVRQCTDAYALRKSEFEARWTQKIQKLLRFIPHVEVTSNVKLRLVGDLPAASNPDTAADGILVAQSVAVSVGIPGSYYHEVWASRERAAGERPADPDATAIHKIEQEIRESVTNAVTHLLPIVPDASQPSSVVVSTFPDLPTQTAERVGFPFPPLGNQVAVVMFLSAAVCVFFALRGFVTDLRGAPPRSDRVEAPDENRHATSPLKVVREESPDPSGDAVPLAPVPTQRPEKTTVHDELTHIVREHPQAAAEMLKQWVEKAG